MTEAIGVGGYTRPASTPASVRLDLNEAPRELGGVFRTRLLELLAAREWHRYPEIDARSAREAAASLYGWKPAGTLVGNGSNELLLASARAFLPRGGTLVTPWPSFSMYPVLAARTESQHVTVALELPKFELDAERLLEAARKAQLVVLCSPNNPTGGLVDEELVRAVLELGVVTIWDAAYVEFSLQRTLELQERYENLVVLRTLSKAWGLAGLRVGALLAAPSLAKQVVAQLIPYQSGWLASAAYAAAAELRELGAALVAEVVAERDRQLAAIERLGGFEVVASASNFYPLHRVGLTGRQLHAALAARGVAVRFVPELDDAGWVRVSVGARTDGDALLEALAGVANG
jgi:histidinol-phosphate aminotransferase